MVFRIGKRPAFVKLICQNRRRSIRHVERGIRFSDGGLSEFQCFRQRFAALQKAVGDKQLTMQLRFIVAFDKFIRPTAISVTSGCALRFLMEVEQDLIFSAVSELTPTELKNTARSSRSISDKFFDYFEATPVRWNLSPLTNLSQILPLRGKSRRQTSRRQFVIKRRKISILPRREQRSFGFERTFLLQKSASEGNVRPGVTRLDFDGFACQFDRFRAVIVCRKPICRADEQKQIIRIGDERFCHLGFSVSAFSGIKQRQDQPGSRGNVCVVLRQNFAVKRGCFVRFPDGAFHFRQTAFGND